MFTEFSGPAVATLHLRFSSLDSPQREIEMFFTYGASGGDPSPIKYFCTLGIGSVPGRSRDIVSMGCAQTQFSDDCQPLLRQERDLGFGNENAFELYYVAVLTWVAQCNSQVEVIDSGFAGPIQRIASADRSHPALLAGLCVSVASLV
jgi:hypothetical protein